VRLLTGYGSVITNTVARRVGRTASEYGIRTTTLFTDPDARSQHALSSPYAINLGDPSAYLDGDRIIQIAKEQGCQGIHPGYGFVWSFVNDAVDEANGDGS
jgi:3-methylcrotonyl-CoA carboxylase alpha subunit